MRSRPAKAQGWPIGAMGARGASPGKDQAIAAGVAVVGHLGRSGRAGQGGVRSLPQALSHRTAMGAALTCVGGIHTAQQLAWQPVQVGSQARPQWAMAASVEAARAGVPTSVLTPECVSWMAGPAADVACAAPAHCRGSRANKQQVSQKRMDPF